eukprot:gene31193-41561_t
MSKERLCNSTQNDIRRDNPELRVQDPCPVCNFKIGYHDNFQPPATASTNLAPVLQWLFDWRLSSYFRVTGRIDDSRTSKGYSSTNALLSFRYIHPTFGRKFIVDEEVSEVSVSQAMKRVFHVLYESKDNTDSPIMSLADAKHVLSSDKESSCYDPLKALQSLEDITLFPGLKCYKCHLVSRKVRATTNNVNNLIWGSWIFHDYFDALNTQNVGVPVIAVKYIGMEEHTTDNLPVGENKMVSRVKVYVTITFFDDVIGRKTSIMFQPIMKVGTKMLSDLEYESFLYPQSPVEFKKFLEIKYEETMKIWREEEGN